MTMTITLAELKDLAGLMTSKKKEAKKLKKSGNIGDAIELLEQVSKDYNDKTKNLPKSGENEYEAVKLFVEQKLKVMHQNILSLIQSYNIEEKKQSGRKERARFDALTEIEKERYTEGNAEKESAEVIKERREKQALIAEKQKEGRKARRHWEEVLGIDKERNTEVEERKNNVEKKVNKVLDNFAKIVNELAPNQDSTKREQRIYDAASGLLTSLGTSSSEFLINPLDLERQNTFKQEFSKLVDEALTGDLSQEPTTYKAAIKTLKEVANFFIRLFTTNKDRFYPTENPLVIKLKTIRDSLDVEESLIANPDEPTVR